MADKNNPIIEDYSTGGHHRLRTSHFLTPSVSSIHGPAAAPFLHPSIPAVGRKTPPFKVKFNGWRLPRDNWNAWADQMMSLHEQTWRKAGIFHAVMSSKCRIRRHDEVVFGLVERWCPATNSFVFSWGEATVTLEDVVEIGGLSVLGESVWNKPAKDERETVQKLMNARYEITKTKAKNADQGKWVERFMGKGSRVEHEAFLACWLSRFVFPLSAGTIHRSVVSVAVRLARGTKIALAPAVLASVYKNLSRLKAALVAARKSENGSSDFQVVVSAPLALFQVWIWERFPMLRQKPNSVGESEPRMARWHELKKSRVEDVQLRLDSAGGKFKWRPYTRKIHRDVAIGSGLDEDLEGLVRCLRTSELVGLEEDCMEQYLPHRVSQQFGLDQDIPGHVPRLNVNRQIAWNDYVRPITDVKLYVPHRPRLTTRYLKWWRRLSLGWSGQSNKDGENSSERSNVEAGKAINGMKLEDDGFVHPPPGFPPKWQHVEAGSSKKVPDRMNDDFVSQEVALAQKQSPLSSSADNGEKADLYGRNGSKRKFLESSLSDVSDYKDCVSPHGFGLKAKASDSRIRVEKLVAEQSSRGSDHGNKSDRLQEDDQSKDHLSSMPMNDADTIHDETLLVENAESRVKCTLRKEASEGLNMELGVSSIGVSSSTSEIAGMGFEERIDIIEKVIYWLKAGKLVCR